MRVLWAPSPVLINWFSAKLLEVIAKVTTTELDEEVKEKISELKIDLAKNVEENKKVADLRKTLNSVAPLLEDLENSSATRKSTLKRPLEGASVRFSKKARNSIWTNQERLSKSDKGETEEEFVTPSKKVSFM